MKTKEEYQNAINEISEVCKKHNIIIVGTPEYDQQMYVIDANELPYDILSEGALNQVRFDEYEQMMMLSGIGNINKDAYNSLIENQEKRRKDIEEKTKNQAMGEYIVPDPFIPGQ